MKLEQRIYCIEGVWAWGDREVEPSVEPLLEMLRRQGQWSYLRRDCATTAELKHYLDSEWARCRMGSVLYIATHGGQSTISMSEGQDLGLDTLGEWLAGQCEHCLVHFSGCEVLGGRKRTVHQRIKTFLDKTGAMGVSGYGAEVGWTDASWAPAAALELLFFSSIREQKIDLEVGRHFRRLNRIVRNLQGRFRDCEFDLYTRRDARIRA